jgi:hypothetical protein
MTTNFYTDIRSILYNGCQYFPNLVTHENSRLDPCKDNYELFEQIKNELSINNEILVDWSKHHKIENPEIPSLVVGLRPQPKKELHQILLQELAFLHPYWLKIVKHLI